MNHSPLTEGFPRELVTPFTISGSSVLLAILLAASPRASAQNFTEYPLPFASSGNDASEITTGPDGNLWFAERAANRIGRITPAGAITEFSLPVAGREPFGITAGPDGNLWFTEGKAGIGRITPSGAITEFPVPSSGTMPEGIVAGPDGNLWFTEFLGSSIGRITTTGSVTEFPIPTSGSQPEGIRVGPDGALWFAEFAGNRIGRITTAGVITEFLVPSANAQLVGTTTGPDGALWFTELGPGKIGRITTAGAITEFGLPSSDAAPAGLVVGRDGALWFVEFTGNRIGRITTNGTVNEFPVPTSASGPNRITLGPDGNLWFTEALANRIGRFAPPTLFLLPSSAHGPGKNNAFFTTDLGVANFGRTPARMTLQFLGHDKDGRTGPTRQATLEAGKSVLYSDILGSLFGATADFGAILITADSPSLRIVSQTSTPCGVPVPCSVSGGTFGQGIPAASSGDLVVNGTPRVFTTLREDPRSRTNLVIANATEASLDVDLALLANDGTLLGSRRESYGPLEMRQSNNIITSFPGVTGAQNATLIVSTPTPSGAFASFCSVLDNTTNDPRTLLP